MLHLQHLWRVRARGQGAENWAMGRCRMLLEAQMPSMNGTRLSAGFVDFEGGGGLRATGARRSSVQTLLVGAACGGGRGFAFRSCWWEPRAALAETRLPGATLCRPFRAHAGCRRKAVKVRNCVLFECHSCLASFSRKDGRMRTKLRLTGCPSWQALFAHRLLTDCSPCAPWSMVGWLLSHCCRRVWLRCCRGECRCRPEWSHR